MNNDQLKAGSMNCAAFLFRTGSHIQDNLQEEVAHWQEQDEHRNLEIINAQEAKDISEAEAASMFQAELKRRQLNDN
jgi:hypothetical protein